MRAAAEPAVKEAVAFAKAEATIRGLPAPGNQSMTRECEAPLSLEIRGWPRATSV